MRGSSGYTPKLVDGRVGRLRSAADDPAGRLRRRNRRADVGEVHEGGDRAATRQTAFSRRGPRHGEGLPARRASCPRRAAHDVEVVNDDGETSRRSMVYTDYFVRGTEPTEICPLHGGGSLLNKFAAIFGRARRARAAVTTR